MNLSLGLLECPQDMVAGFQQSKGHHKVFYDRVLEVTLAILQYPMVPQVSHTQGVREPQKGVNTRR